MIHLFRLDYPAVKHVLRTGPPSPCWFKQAKPSPHSTPWPPTRPSGSKVPTVTSYWPP